MARERLNLRRRKFATCPGACSWPELAIALLFLGSPAGADPKRVESENTGWQALAPGSGPEADSTSFGFGVDEANNAVHDAMLGFRCRKGELEAFVIADSVLFDPHDARKVRPFRFRIDGGDWSPGRG